MKIWLWFKEIKRELIHMVDLLRDRESEMHSLNSKWQKSIFFTLLQNAKERIHSTPNNTFVYWAQSIQNHFSYFMQETFRFFLSSSDKLFPVSPRLIRSGSVNTTQCWWWVNMFSVPFEFFVNKKIITFLWFCFSKYFLGFFMHLAFWFHRSTILLFYFYSCFGVPFARWFIRFHWEFWRV